METNLEKYKKDLKKLIDDGKQLFIAMLTAFAPDRLNDILNKDLKTKEEISKFLEKPPNFYNDYQTWYTEALILLKQLLPDRVSDFVKLYEKPKTRKNVTRENYTIEDALQGLYTKDGLNQKAAIPRFKQQLSIIESVNRRFESSLFNIKQLVQADLFDSELESAEELNKKGFIRAAGAVAGVVLEKHLAQVCENHKIKITKKDPTINDYNQLLKNNDVIETEDWRFIQRLADLRNLCDHSKEREPKKEEIDELINGVEKMTKTIF